MSGEMTFTHQSAPAGGGRAVLEAAVAGAADLLDDPAELRHLADPVCVDEARTIDLAAAERSIRSLLVALGENPDSVHLRQTPRRVAAAYAELLAADPFTLTTFPNDEGYTGLVLCTAIPVQSLCEHHLMPFHGTAHVGYLPGQRIVGLSKLARVVDHFARRLQVQERLTAQIADYLSAQLRPAGVGVVIQAEHQCMTFRGVRAHGARTHTSAFYGQLRSDAAARREFLTLSNGG